MRACTDEVGIKISEGNYAGRGAAGAVSELSKRHMADEIKACDVDCGIPHGEERALARVSNHEEFAAILRDAAKWPLLRMRSAYCHTT
jgi:hypothetical protein